MQTVLFSGSSSNAFGADISELLPGGSTDFIELLSQHGQTVTIKSIARGIGTAHGNES
jgi:hypothetical protein